MSDEHKTARVRMLNDAFRTTFQGGKMVLTRGVIAQGAVIVNALVERIRTYERFDEGNDPYGEHDFGAFDHEGQKYFWKIDYFDRSMTYHSDDAADPQKTVRVLTLMLADEY